MVHHNFKKGQKVYVIYNDGRTLISKYKGTLANYLELEDAKISWKEIRSSTIYKNGIN